MTKLPAPVEVRRFATDGSRDVAGQLTIRVGDRVHLWNSVYSFTVCDRTLGGHLVVRIGRPGRWSSGPRDVTIEQVRRWRHKGDAA